LNFFHSQKFLPHDNYAVLFVKIHALFDYPADFLFAFPVEVKIGAVAARPFGVVRKCSIIEKVKLDKIFI